MNNATPATPATQPTYEQLLARVQELERVNKRSTGIVTSNKLTLRVGEKGTLSIYGLGKFPWSPYLSQVERVIEIVKSGELEQFITAHRSQFSVKPEKAAE